MMAACELWYRLLLLLASCLTAAWRLGLISAWFVFECGGTMITCSAHAYCIIYYNGMHGV